MPSQDATYRFGPYELRARTHEVYKGSCKLKVRPQHFQVLRALLERSGGVITREELRQLLWSTETFVDFEHGLNTVIKELRGLLNDSASEPRYIETIPKVGYRMVASVEVEASRHPENNAGTADTESQRSTPAQDSHEFRTWRSGLVWLTVIVILCGLGIGLYRWRKSQETLRSAKASEARAKNTRLMLAVLPFENLTGDEGQEYFSDGLTEEMIAQLGRMDPQYLGVIARTSVMHYKHGIANVEQIGKELGVQYVLEGSVRRESERVRISAQLIQVKDQTHLWSRQYDREQGKLLAMQGEIAREISDEVELTFGGRVVPNSEHAAASPVGYEVYDLYLKGLYFWNKRTISGFEKAIGYFQQGIARDPNYAPAYAALANSYTLLSAYGITPGSRYMPNARAAALKALEIDANLAEAHTALALVVQNYDYDWETSEKEFRRAIELDPNYVTAHHWYAEHLMWMGRFDEAFQESERARQLDPLSLIVATDHGVLLYCARQYDGAIEQFRTVLEMDPMFTRAHMIDYAYEEKGMYKEVSADLENVRRHYGPAPWYWSDIALMYGRTGQQEQARHALEKLKELDRRDTVAPPIFVRAYLGVGDKERALTYLEKAYAGRYADLATLKAEPVYDPLRSEARFQELLRKTGLATGSQ